MTMQQIDPAAIRRTNIVLTAGTWFLILGVVFYSLMTTTPFVAGHSAPGWEWSGWVLGLMVDIAFVMALQADSMLAQIEAADLGTWPRVFRWFTGGASVFLNTWTSMQHRDAVGVAVHLIAPALLLTVAEVGPVYRRAMAEALRRAEVDSRVDTSPAVVDIPASVPLISAQRTPDTAPAQYLAPLPAEPIAPQVIPVDTVPPEMPAAPSEAEQPVDGDAPLRLSADAARKAIEDGWVNGRSIRETAAVATRSPAYVSKVFTALDDRRGPRPAAGQLSLVKAEA